MVYEVASMHRMNLTLNTDMSDTSDARACGDKCYVYMTCFKSLILQQTLILKCIITLF